MKSAIPSFVNLNQIDDLDRKPFKFGHNFLDHPAMTMENLKKLIPALPKDQVFYSSGNLSKSDDFDRAHLDKKNGLSIEETIHRMMEVDSYIMVRSPELDPSFKDLYAQLKSCVDEIIRFRAVGNRAIDPMLYMFIASPGSVTPFHIDRYSTFLLQFRGQKKVSIYPAWDEEIIAANVLEGFMARTGVRPSYEESFANKAQVFDFGPGEAIHIPFVAGHDVKNGNDDISISLSIIFNTKETRRQMEALSFNHLLRQRLKLSPVAIGQQPFADRIKAGAYRSYSQTKKVFKG